MQFDWINFYSEFATKLSYAYLGLLAGGQRTASDQFRWKHKAYGFP